MSRLPFLANWKSGKRCHWGIGHYQRTPTENCGSPWPVHTPHTESAVFPRERVKIWGACRMPGTEQIIITPESICNSLSEQELGYISGPAMTYNCQPVYEQPICRSARTRTATSWTLGKGSRPHHVSEHISRLWVTSMWCEGLGETLLKKIMYKWAKKKLFWYS